jgi:hypothetical protein
MTTENSKNIKCEYCTYVTNKRFNLNRHHNTKHKDIKIKEDNIIQDENISLNEETINTSLSMCCSKCNKSYNSNRYLKNHELKCNGIDILTCPKCRKSFTSRQHKYTHIKNNKCKPVCLIDTKIFNKEINYIYLLYEREFIHLLTFKMPTKMI